MACNITYHHLILATIIKITCTVSMYNHPTVCTVLQYDVAFRKQVQYVVKKLMAQLINSTRIIRVWQVYLFSSQLGSKGQRSETHSVNNVCEWLCTFTWIVTANIKNKVIHVLSIHVHANNTNVTTIIFLLTVQVLFLRKQNFL